MNTAEHDLVTPEARRERILTEVHARGACRVEDLAERFGVSGMTIRRDLQELADAGRVMRIQGGAAPASRVSFEFGFLERAEHHRAEKDAIAHAAAALVDDGAAVMLDSGTTTLALARQLKAKRDLTVITTSLPIAGELYAWDTIRVLLLGGYLRRDAPDLAGPLTERALETLHGQVAFLGADGIDARGNVYNSDPAVGRMLERMAAACDRVYIVADHAKFDRRALYRFGNASDWAGVITDRRLDRKLLGRLKHAGVKVILATDTAPKERKP